MSLPWDNPELAMKLKIADLAHRRAMRAAEAPRRKLEPFVSPTPTFWQLLLAPDPLDDLDLGDCPYYDGRGICGYGCTEEPACQTDEPEGGWPSWWRRWLEAQVQLELPLEP